MHVTIVSQYFWPETFRINDLAAGLVARGHRVSVLTGYPSYPRRGDFPQPRPRFETVGGAEVVRVPMASRGGGGRRGLTANYLSYAAAASLLGPSWLPDGTDVSLVFQMSPVSQVLPAFVLRATRGAPVVAWVQDLWPQSLTAAGVVSSPTALAVLDRMVGSLYRNCDRLLVQSEAFREPLTLARVPSERIEYLPNWAEELYRPLRDSTDDSRDGSTDQPVETPDGFVVMVAGNIGRAQSLGTVLGAAERLRDRPDVHWVVVGDGVRRDWLAAEVARRRLSATVHLIGRLPVERMPGLFARADALLVTLVRDPLMAMTVPSRLQSYLASGRPVVAALDGEGARVVREAGSLAVPAEDEVGLARVVLAVRAMSPSQRAACGESARRYYLHHFDRDTLVDRAERLLAETVESVKSVESADRRPRRRPRRRPGGGLSAGRLAAATVLGGS